MGGWIGWSGPARRSSPARRTGRGGMVDRVESLLGTRVAKGMWILTFHSACARLLRREHNHLGLPSSFSIYDEGDTQRLLTMVLRDLNLDPKRFPPRAMAAGIGKAKDHLIGPQQALQD